MFHTKQAYNCLICPKAAEDGYSCCSKECRMKVPNCKTEGCGRATVPGIYQGQPIFSQHCFGHGGRERFDGDETFSVRKKKTFVLTVGGWQEAVWTNYDHLATDEPLDPRTARLVAAAHSH